MAEDVIIKGFASAGGGDSIPDFATEASIKVMATALRQANAYNASMAKHLAQLSGGEKKANIAMNKLAAEVEKLSSDTNNNAKKEAKDNAEQQKLAEKQLGHFGKLMQISKETMNMHKKNFTEQLKNDEERNKLIAKYGEANGDGMSGTTAALIAGLKGVTGVATKVAAGVVAVASAVKGANNYLLQQGTDRFNFAQELRQSGLAAGLSESGASLTAFADKVRGNNFTLGEAAEFTQRFSKTIGVTGVESAMGFVNSLALAGQDGGDMMRKYGMEFGEVANISGEYLESVQALGMLDKMSSADLRSGMTDFMSTVVATSNIMKINLEDAAQMIKDTLKRDDITALLATMAPDKADQVRDVVGLAGGTQSKLGEQLAMRLAAGSQSQYMQTQQYQELAGSNLGMEFLPIIERLAQAAERNGTEGFQAAFSSFGTDMERIQAIATDQRAIQLSGGDQTGQQMLAEGLRMRQTAEDADAGRAAISADDVAVVGAIETQRQMTVAMEGVNNAMVASSNFAENVNKINASNLKLINTLETEATVVAGAISEPIFNTTTELQAGVTDIISGTVSAVGDFARDMGLMGSEADKTAAAVRAMRVSINETFGGGSVINADGKIANQEVADLVARITEKEREIAENPNDRTGIASGELSNLRMELIGLVDEIEVQAPNAAAQLRVETGINKLVGEGETVAYDPTLLRNQNLMSRTGYRRPREDSDGYILQGGGRMEKREDAIDRVAAQFQGLGSLITSDILNTDGVDMLKTLGFGVDDNKDSLTSQEVAQTSELIAALTQNQLMNVEQLEALRIAIAESTGTKGIFDFDEATVADSDQRDKLVTAIELLIRQLNG